MKTPGIKIIMHDVIKYENTLRNLSSDLSEI